MPQQMNKFEIRAGAIVIEAIAAHPNKMKFSGVLTRVDEASTKPPNGSQGHRIFMSTDVAKKRIGTLIGMGLNYSATLDGHAQRRKVGVINKAWLDGKDLRVEGTIWKHDFPEAEKDLKQSGLGMSMEIGDVRIENPKADVWNIVDCCFLGATILFKDAAAYYRTQAIAAKAAGGGTMPITKKKVAAKSAKSGDERIAEVVAAAVAGALLPTLTRQTKIMAGVNKSLAHFGEMLASAVGDDEDEIKIDTVNAGDDQDDDEDDQDDDGKGKKGEDDDEEDDDEDDINTEVDDEDKPGTINKNTKNHGDDTTVDDDQGADKKEPITGSAFRKLQAQVRKLARTNAELVQAVNASQAENKRLKTEQGKLKVQVTASAAETNRRSLTPELTALLSKANISPDDIRASGQKLGVAEVDAVLNLHPGLDNETRISLKNGLLKADLMDEGRVDRGFKRIGQ
jgi:hypothetical protein